MAKKSAGAGGEIGFETKFKVHVKKAGTDEWVEQELEFLGSDFDKLEDKSNEEQKRMLFDMIPGFMEFYEQAKDAYLEEKRKRLEKGE